MSVLPRTTQLKDGSSLTIREATSEDAKAMIDMVLNILGNSKYTLTKADEFNYTVEEEAKLLQKKQDIPGSIFIVAEQDGQLVGNLSFTNGSKGRNQHQGELAMGIIPSHRGKGIGTQLLELLIEWAEKNDVIQKVKLQVVIQHSHAIHVYKNLGFIEEGRLIKDVKMDNGDFVDVIMMYKFV